MAKSLSQADKEAKDIVDAWAIGALSTGWIPGSAFFLTATDTVMINQVASVYSVGVFDMDNVKATIGGVVASAIAGGVIAEVVGLIPIIGWAIKSAAMGAKTEIIGEAVMDYFRELSPLR